MLFLCCDWSCVHLFCVSLYSTFSVFLFSYISSFVVTYLFKIYTIFITFNFKFSNNKPNGSWEDRQLYLYKTPAYISYNMWTLNIIYNLCILLKYILTYLLTPLPWAWVLKSHSQGCRNVSRYRGNLFDYLS